MIPTTLAAIAATTGGSLVPADAGGLLVDGPVVTDSREAAKGSLYVARVGEHADGHEFAGSAASSGAVGVIGVRPIDGVPTVVVSDTQQAFAALARSVVDRGVAGDLRIVGITGSSGKTSTKDMLGQVLAVAGETVAPVGSYNSEVGVPLTVCRITEATRYLVAEMGASGIGHVAYLTRIAPPEIGIVLNVGVAHVGEFGSVDNIAIAKAELVQALPRSGLAILNHDDARVRAMASATAARVLTVGNTAGADVIAADIRLDCHGHATFELTGVIGSGQVRLGLSGAHQVGNALAVLVAATEFGMPLSVAIAALADAGPVSRWRMEVFDLPTGVTLINDAYNANPDSMRAALVALSQLSAGKRGIAVLGEMRELGDESASAHLAMGQLAAELGIDRVIAVGPGAQGIADGFVGSIGLAVTAPDVEAAEAILTGLLTDGDVVLFKSSRDSGLRYLGDRFAVAGGAELP